MWPVHACLHELLLHYAYLLPNFKDNLYIIKDWSNIARLRCHVRLDSVVKKSWQVMESP